MTPQATYRSKLSGGAKGLDTQASADQSHTTSSSSPTGVGPWIVQNSALGPTSSEPEAALAGASFEDLCHHGTKWTWANWRVKLYRYTLYPLQQVFLFWQALRPTPTHMVTLSFRAMVRDAGEPNCNADYLAAKFRDELMPLSAQLSKRKSPILSIGRTLMELPLLGVPGGVRWIDTRTQWFDDTVDAAIADGIKQVVIIAAGYDSRAYRLAKPGVRFFEVDLPSASKQKQELVRKLLPADKFPRPEYVAADLSVVALADALAATSFDPQQPALFTIEGLVYYLPAGAVQQLLSSIQSTSAPKSRIAMDFVHLSALSGSVWRPGFEALWLAFYNKGERLISGIDERPAAAAALMRLFGFRTDAVLTARGLVQKYMPHVQYRAVPGATVIPYYGCMSAEKL